MRAMRAESFTGYEGLKLVDLPKPVVPDGRVLLRMTAPASRRSTIRFSPANFTTRRRRWSWATKERAWCRREGERTFPSAHA